MRRTRGEKIFAIFNYIFLTLLISLCLLPMLHILAKSFSNGLAVSKGEVVFWPVNPTLSSYKYVISNVQFIRSFTNTVFITVVGTAISIVVTIFTAFVFMKKEMPFHGLYVGLYVFTMFFSGGIVPSYLHYNTYGLLNTYWVLILPNCINVFHTVLMRNYFQGIPGSLEESAKLDGASDFTVLWKIYVPLSVASIATITLYHAVILWNAYFGALMFTSKRELMPLQLYLRNLLTDINTEIQDTDPALINELANDSITSATIMTAVIPILCVYPFIQRYFVGGVTLGAVKE